MDSETQNAINSPNVARPEVSQSGRFAEIVPGAALIVLLTFAAYWPVLLRGQFIWDDPLLVEKNPLVTQTLNLRSVWFQTDFPLSVVAFWLQWLSWGKAAAGYHIVNVLLHALNSVLVWRVLRRLNIRGAWLAGAIFAVHPVCAASVAWISELKNTLSLPFFLLSIWFYLRRTQKADSENHASRNTQYLWYALSLAAFVLALLAKTSTVMLPVVLLGCAWWLRGRITKQDWLRTAPFFALALAFGLMSIWFQTHQTFTTGKVQTENFWGRLAAAGTAVWFYLWKAVLPLNLNLIYPRWNINAASPLSYLPALLLCGAFVLCWKFRRSWGRPALFGFGFFVVNLFPVLGFFDMYFLAISRVSDHFQYLPLIGIVGLSAGAIHWDVPRMRLNGAQLLIKTTLIVALAFLTVQRARVMATDESLWRDTLAKNPTAWPAHNNFGCILAEQNKLDDAIAHFRSSLVYNPNNAQAHCNLGKALTQQHRLPEAETELQTAVTLKPREPEFHRSLAYALGGQGKTDEALGQLRQAADLDKSVSRRLELAGMLHQMGKDREAVAEYRRVLGTQPLSVEILNNLAWILATSADDSVRNGADAVGFAEKACQQTQNQDAMTIGTLAAAYAEAGRFSDAAATAEKAANLASVEGNSRFATINTQLMQLYRSGKPYHEKAPAIRKP
jgi:tetratricopeptide (TPR) repeat protein